jgi:hypothetical protein
LCCWCSSAAREIFAHRIPVRLHLSFAAASVAPIFLFIFFIFLFDLNMQYGTIGVITGTFKFPFLAFFFNVEMLLGPLSPRRKK